MCQPEENAKVYLDTAKQLYKGACDGTKNKNTGNLVVASIPIAVKMSLA